MWFVLVFRYVYFGICVYNFPTLILVFFVFRWNSFRHFFKLLLTEKILNFCCNLQRLHKELVKNLNSIEHKNLPNYPQARMLMQDKR